MRRRSGFTLLEMLVVVAVIGLLISILAPALAASRRKGQRLSCATRLNEVGRALWAYSVANDGRLPYVESPMTNGVSVPGFGDPASTDEEINPFDASRWPLSLPNLFSPLYLGDGHKVWTCPSAQLGWPRRGGAFELTFRDAGANQPNGLVSPEGSYLRESFGFLDGRPMVEARMRLTDDPIVNLQRLGATRGAYLRDLVQVEGGRLIGPHDLGINLINREFGVEYRSQRVAQDDLRPFGHGVGF